VHDSKADGRKNGESKFTVLMNSSCTSRNAFYWPMCWPAPFRHLACSCRKLKNYAAI